MFDMYQCCRQCQLCWCHLTLQSTPEHQRDGQLWWQQLTRDIMVWSELCSKTRGQMSMSEIIRVSSVFFCISFILQNLNEKLFVNIYKVWSVSDTQCWHCCTNNEFLFPLWMHLQQSNLMNTNNTYFHFLLVCVNSVEMINHNSQTDTITRK